MALTARGFWTVTSGADECPELPTTAGSPTDPAKKVAEKAMIEDHHKWQYKTSAAHWVIYGNMEPKYQGLCSTKIEAVCLNCVKKKAKADPVRKFDEKNFIGIETEYDDDDDDKVMPIFRHEYVFIILNGLPDTTEWNLCVKFTKEHDNPPIRGNPRKDNKPKDSSQEKGKNRPKRDITLVYNHCTTRGHIEDDCRHKKNGMSAAKRPDSDKDKTEKPPKDKVNSAIENVWMLKTTNSRRLNSGDWFVESGCTTHVCGHKETFQSLTYDTPKGLQGFDQNIIKSYGRGSAAIKTRLPGTGEVIAGYQIGTRFERELKEVEIEGSEEGVEGRDGQRVEKGTNAEGVDEIEREREVAVGAARRE
ncbi:hypothetical protein FPQ18DRAFT_307398 [Pyronema domesticum]|nr:hypothetical protein FPQ18DRAFT_307398 [Pyronema domesticum]